MAEDYEMSFDDFLPVDEYFDMRQLAKKIAETDTLVQNIKTLEEENAGFKQKLLDFNESAKQVKTLLDQEKVQTCELKKNNFELKEKLKNAEAQVAALQNSKNNWELINEQHIAKYERLLHDEKNSSQGRYSDICQKFVNQAKILSENDLLHGSCKKDFGEIKRYAQNKLIDIDFDLPKKLIKKPNSVSQCTSTDVEKKDAETLCNMPQVIENGKTFVTRATQYMCSTTTRSACTSAFIKKHNVGTNFPEVVPISIEQIFRETYLKIPKAIEAIEDLPQQFFKENSTQTRKPSIQTTGTCTNIKNIRRPVYYYYPYIKNNIKIEKKSPASSMLNVNIDHLDQERVNSTRQSQLSGLWSLLGQTIFALIGEDNQDVNQLQLKDIKDSMGLIKTQLEQNFFEKEEMISLASPSIPTTDKGFYEDSGSMDTASLMDTYNGDDSNFSEDHIHTGILRESISSNTSTSSKNIEIQNILFDYKLPEDNDFVQDNSENNCFPFEDTLENSNNHIDKEYSKVKENIANLNRNNYEEKQDNNCLIRKSSTEISTQTYNFDINKDCGEDTTQIEDPEYEHDNISSILSQSTSKPSNHETFTLISSDELCQSNELTMNIALNTKNDHNFKIPSSELIYDRYKHCKLEKQTEILEKSIRSSLNDNGFTFSQSDDNLINCEGPEENMKIDLNNTLELNSISNHLKFENSKKCKKRKVPKQKTNICNRKKFKSTTENEHNLNTKLDLKKKGVRKLGNFINFIKETEEKVDLEETDKNPDKDLKLEEVTNYTTEKFDKFMQKILKGYSLTTDPIKNNIPESKNKIPESKKSDPENLPVNKPPNELTEKVFSPLSDHNYVLTPQKCANIISVQTLENNTYDLDSGHYIDTDVLADVVLENNLYNEDIVEYPVTTSLIELQPGEYIDESDTREEDNIDVKECVIPSQVDGPDLVELKTSDNICNENNNNKNTSDNEDSESNGFNDADLNPSGSDLTSSPTSPPFFEQEWFGRCPSPVEIPLSIQDINFSPLSPRRHVDENNCVHLKGTKIIPLNRKIRGKPKNPQGKHLDSAIGNILKKYSVRTRQKVCSENLKETANESKLIRKVRKILEIYVTHEATDNRIRKCVARLLKATKNQKLISKSIIEIIEDTDEDTCIKYTPPAPSMPETHQKLILMLELFQSYVPQFPNSLLKSIDKRLFSLGSKITQLTDLLNVTQFYLALIDRQTSSLDINPARLFMFKCFYYHKKCALPMVYQVITTYPHILPAKDDEYYDNSDAILSTILCIMNSYPYDMESLDLKHRQLYHILKFHYQYERVKPSREEVIDNLMAKIRAKRFKHVVHAFALICKWNDIEWTEKYVIEKYIIPVLTEYLHDADKTDENDEIIVHLIESLSSILKPFPLKTDLSRFQNLFVHILHTTQRQILQEAAISALLRLSQFGYVDCFNRIYNWKPLANQKISRKLKIMLRSFIYRKNLRFWIKLKDQI